MKRNFLSFIMATSGLYLLAQTYQSPSFIINQPVSGTKYYEASRFIDMGVDAGSTTGFSYDAVNEGGEFTAIINPYLLFPPVEGEIGGPGINDEGMVGTMGGAYNVSSNGAVTYTFPIKLPIGINGLQPQLSIDYNSQGANGIMGFGWNLGGLSSITRIGSNYFNDGKVTGVKFDGSDFFALDGNRLHCIQGQYGQNAEYRTEVETYSKIISYRTVNNGPEYFIVYAKSGQIIEYGKSENSRIELQGTNNVVRTWLINRVSDRFGNSIVFDYIENNATGEYMIDKIKYAGNPSQNVEYQCEIRFGYRCDRKDKVTNYIFPDKKSSLNQLMESVQVYVNNKLQNQYELSYILGSPARLINIKMVNPDNTILNPVEFVYHDSPVLNFTSGVYGITYYYEYDGQGFVYDSEKSVMADFNGDGLLDILVVYYFRNNPKKVVGYKQYLQTYGSNFIEHESGPLPNEEFIRFLPCDLNGDFKTDLLMVKTALSNDRRTDIVPWISTGSGFDKKPNFYADYNYKNIKLFPADFNGDGKSELTIAITPDLDEDKTIFKTYSFNFSPQYELITWPEYTNYNTSVAHYFDIRDMDADGIPELIRLKSDGMYVFKYLFNPDQTIAPPTYYDFPSSKLQVYWGDFNSDGFTDILYRNKETKKWGTRIFNGNTFIPFDCPITKKLDPSTDAIAYSIKDFNGDGLADICERYLVEDSLPKIIYRNDFYFFNGNNFNIVPKSFDIANVDFDVTNLVSDFNGDGINDLMFQTNKTGIESTELTVCRIHSGNLSRQIQIIRDEYDNETKFTYKYLPFCNGNSEPEYIRYSDSDYPFVDFQGPLAVVTQTERNDGLGDQPENLRKRNYFYEGAKIHQLGKGYLGFIKTKFVDAEVGTTFENINKLAVTSNYIVVYPWKSITTILINGVNQKLNETENNYYIYNNYNYWNKRYAPYLLQSHYREWDLDGTFVKSQRKVLTYDANGYTYGNAKKEGNYSDEINLGPTAPLAAFRIGKEINNYYYYYDPNLINDWLLSVTDSVIIRQYLKDEPDVVERLHLQYYQPPHPSYPLLKKSIKNPGNSLELVTDFSYNGLGLLTSKSASTPRYSPALPARQETYSYKPEYGYRFMSQTSNSLNHTTENIFDTDKGTLQRKLDANHFEQQYFYDSFGRLIKTINYDNTEKVSVLRWANGQDDFREKALWYSWECVSGQNPVLTFFDKLGRDIRIVSYNQNGEKVYVDKEYDHFGRIISVSEPHLPEVNNYLLTTYQYDELGRSKLITSPGDITLGYKYEARNIIVTNDFGKSANKITNAAGWLVSSTDTDGKTVEYTNFSNGNVRTTTVEGNKDTKITFEYDINGNKTRTIDPSWGSSIGQYNPYGELVYSEDSRHNKYSFTYDILGRLLTRINPDVQNDHSHWIYEDSPGKLGLLRSENTGNGHEKTYIYGAYNRLKGISEVIGSSLFESSFTYDELGRQNSVTYPNGLVLNYRYNDAGAIKQIIRQSDGAIVWEGISYNKDGQLTLSKIGNNMLLDHTYYPETKQLWTTTCENIQSFEYVYDNLGNMTYRYDHLHKVNNLSLNEHFSYDNRNQLTAVYRNGAYPRYFQYDALGNIMSKNDVGSFTYNKPSPYQTSDLAPNSNIPVSYISNQEITYNNFNKVDTIVSDNNELEITYGLNQQRISQKLYSGTGANRQFVKEKIYVSGTTEIINFANKTSDTINYIMSPEGLTAIQISYSSGGKEWYWVFTDHLGSITTLLRESDGKKFEMSYDTWGNRRDPATWNNYTKTLPGFIIDRGFTGHEHLDEFGLINMNGRFYDPVIARFLSPDPYIQSPDVPQNYNGYAYCFNNPLKYSDPSGNWIQYAAAGLFFYFQGAYNNRDQATGKWQWNPFKWGGKDSPGLVIGISTNTSFTNTTYYAGVNWNNGMGGASFGYNTGSGFGYGSNPQALYYPESNSNAVAENSVNSISNSLQTYEIVARTAATYMDNLTLKTLSNIPGVWLPGMEIVWNGYYGSGRIRGGVPEWWGGGASSQGGMPDWGNTAIDLSSKTLGGVGLLTKGRELVEWEYLRQAKFNRSLSGNFSQPVKHSLRALKTTGRVLGYTGVALSGVDMAVNGVNVSNSLDLFMGGVAFVPGFGWAVSGFYFVGNFGWQAYSGKTIGESIQSNFTDPNASWKPW